MVVTTKKCGLTCCETKILCFLKMMSPNIGDYAGKSSQPECYNFTVSGRLFESDKMLNVLKAFTVRTV